ncbi:MAG: universal stress protein [Clostridium sp.]
MSFKKILVPIDKSEKTLQSLEQLKTLFRKEEVQIVLLHVIDEFNVSVTDYVSREFMETLETLSQSILERAANLVKDYNVEKISLLGSPKKEILNIAEDKNIDLIIMTKTGAGIVDKYILGSVTSDVIKKANVAVMVIP